MALDRGRAAHHHALIVSRSGEVSLAFGDGEHTFRLPIGGWRRVQEATDAGPFELLARMSAPFQAIKAGVTTADLIGMGLLGFARVDDIRAVVLHGLIGGGATPPEAAQLVAMWVDERPLLESLPIAYQVVFASVTGVEDEASSGGVTGEMEVAPPLSPDQSSGSGSTASMSTVAP